MFGLKIESIACFARLIGSLYRGNKTEISGFLFIVFRIKWICMECNSLHHPIYLMKDIFPQAHMILNIVYLSFKLTCFNMVGRAKKVHK